jgi:hypothetical protein
MYCYAAEVCTAKEKHLDFRVPTLEELRMDKVLSPTCGVHSDVAELEVVRRYGKAISASERNEKEIGKIVCAHCNRRAWVFLD